MHRHSLGSFASLELHSNWRRSADNREGTSILSLPFVLASDKFARIEVVYPLAFPILFGSYSYIVIPLVALSGSSQSDSCIFVSGRHALSHAFYVVVVC